MNDRVIWARVLPAENGDYSIIVSSSYVDRPDPDPWGALKVARAATLGEAMTMRELMLAAVQAQLEKDGVNVARVARL